MKNIHFSRGRRQDGLAIVWDEHAETRHLKHLKQPTGYGIHGYPWLPCLRPKHRGRGKAWATVGLGER